ncbi:PLP-dependent aminotransferase family protein [Pendulispora albinea]|uniref:PLP-dependent aminotransferase family protein n=1 Tax=Pendulispora albinea TaxID=2741071 RepID=A0ABZ2M6T9_9BACT
MVPANRARASKLRLDHRGTTTLTAQLVEQIRRAVLDGALSPGHALPSSRALARDLGISRNTVVAAYDALAADGTILVASRRAPTVADVIRTSRHDLSEDEEEGASPFRISASAQRLMAAISDARLELLLSDSSRARPFRVGEPDLSLFPWHTFERILIRCWRAQSPLDAIGADPRGYLPLRRALLRHLTVARGVRAKVEQVFITEGAQGAFDLCCRTLLDPGDRVWIEDPCVPSIRAALQAAGARICPIAGDGDGLRVTEGRRIAPRAKLAIVSPSYAFPLGGRLGLARRLELLAWARRAGALVLENDYEGELRFEGLPIPALQSLSLEHGGHVLHVGSFGRAMFPALRLGFLVLPRHLVPAFARMRAVATRSSPHLLQAALAHFIEEGHYARHLRRLKQATRRRRDVLVRELEATRRAGETIHVPHAGAVLTLELPPSADDRAIVQSCMRHGIEAMPLSDCAHARRAGLVLGFGAHSEESLVRAVRKLRASVFGL